MIFHPDSEISVGAPTSSKATPVIAADARGGLQQLLRISRIRVGLSFRDASALSRSIAGTLADQMYFTAAGTLSDYEDRSSPPRHIQKIISLCILYCIDCWTFLRAARLPLEALGNDSLPDEMIGRVGSPRTQAIDDMASTTRFGTESSGFLSTLIDQWEELPLFIEKCAPHTFQTEGFFFVRYLLGWWKPRFSPSLSDRLDICRRQPPSQNAGAIDS